MSQFCVASSSLCTIYNMSGRVVSADTNSSRRRDTTLYVRYNTDANVVNGLKNSSSYEPTGEKSFEIDEVYAEKIKVKVSANRQNSVS